MLMSTYILIDIEADNPSQLKRYQELAKPTLKPHNLRLLSKKAQPETLEGEPATRIVVLFETDSVEAARAWFNSPEYSAAKAAREGLAKFTIRLLPSA